MPYELSEIQDFTPEQLDALTKRGINDTEDLLRAARMASDRADLATGLGLSSEAMDDLLSQAGLMRVRGVDANRARLLVAGGVRTASSLGRRDPARLRAVLADAGPHLEAVSAPLGEGDAAAWILAARSVDEALELESDESRKARAGASWGGDSWVDGVLRTLVTPSPEAVDGGGASTAIDAFLEAHAADLGLDQVDVKAEPDRAGAATVVRRLIQSIAGLPLTGAELVVVASARHGAVISVTNDLDLEVDPPVSKNEARQEDLAAQDVLALVQAEFPDADVKGASLTWVRHLDRSSLPDLSDDARGHLESTGLAADACIHLVYEVEVHSHEQDLQVVVDAVTGDVLDVRSLTQSAETEADGLVYMPDPATESNTDLPKESPSSVLNNYRHEVTLKVTRPAEGHAARLEGDWVRCLDWDAPNYAQPAEADGTFKYDARDRAFLSVNAYHWLDSFIRLIRGYGVQAYLDSVDAKDFAHVEIDPQGYHGKDQSSCYSSRDPIQIRFGEGGVPDAADMGVIVHEYIHALVRLCGTTLGGNSGLEHAFCDSMPLIFRDRFNVGRHKRTITFPWDNVSNMWSTERTLDRMEKFTDANFGSYSVNLRNSILGSALWKCYLGVGGDDADAAAREAAGDQMLKTSVEALVALPRSNQNATGLSKAKEIARAILTADLALTGGTHGDALRDAFKDHGIAT